MLLYTLKTMHLVTDWLLVGNLEDARDPSPMIRALLFVAAEHTVRPPAGIDYAKIPLTEFAEPDPVLLAQSVQWIEDRRARSRVMVCCRAGMGRSVSVAIAYLCCAEGLSYDEALKLVKTRRPGAMPLPGLQRAIHEVIKLHTARMKADRPSAQALDPMPGRIPNL